MKMLKLVILLSLLSLATSSSSESFFSSLQNLHNHLKLLPKQLESVHLEYQLQSNTLTPLQLFEKVYNVKIDKKSIEKVGGAKDEVLDLIRKIRKSDSSEEEQNEVLEALGKMEETRGDVRKVLEGKAEDVLRLRSRAREIGYEIKTLKKEKMNLEIAVKDALSTSTVDGFLMTARAKSFASQARKLRRKSQEFTDELKSLGDTVKLFEDEIQYVDSKLDEFQKPLPLKKLKSDYENLELIRNSEADKEMKMVSEVIAKFNEDYGSLQLNVFTVDFPKFELLKEFRFETRDIHLQSRGDFEDLVKLSGFLEQLKSLEANWTHIDEIQHCLDAFYPSLNRLSDEKNKIDDAKKLVADSQGIIEKIQEMSDVFAKLAELSEEFLSTCIDAMASTNFDNVLSSWRKLVKEAEFALDSYKDFPKNFEQIHVIEKKSDIFLQFVDSSTFKSIMEFINCLINLNSTISNIKQSINNIKQFNTTENLKIMEKSVKTLDSLRDLHKLVEDFEAQKLTDRTEKLPEILEPIDKMNTLKTGIEAIGSVLNAHRISKNMLRDSDVFEKFPDSDSYKSSESRIREFFSRFVPTTSSVISTISAVPDAPEFRISPEFVKFATENTVVDVETLMDFEKNWTDLQAKIEKMGRVLKEFEVWVRDGPVIGTTHGTTLAPRGRYGEVICDCEMIDIDNSCDGVCDIDWEI